MYLQFSQDPALISNETDYWPYDTGVTQDVFIKWPNDTGPMDSRPENIPDSDIMLGYVSSFCSVRNLER